VRRRRGSRLRTPTATQVRTGRGLASHQQLQWDCGGLVHVFASNTHQSSLLRDLMCLAVSAGLFSDAMTACRDGGVFIHGEQLLSLWEAEVSRSKPESCVAERHARGSRLGYLPAVCYCVGALQGSHSSVPMLTIFLHSLQSTSGSPAISAEQLLSLKGDHMLCWAGHLQKRGDSEGALRVSRGIPDTARRRRFLERNHHYDEVRPHWYQDA